MLAVIAGLGVLLYAVRAKQSGTPAPRTDTVAAGGDATKNGRRPRLPADLPAGAEPEDPDREEPADGERRSPPPDAAPAELPPVAPETVADLDEAHGRLQDAAKPCVAGKSLPAAATVRFTYTLNISRGKATTADVELVDLIGGAEPIEKCVLEKVAGATWDAGGASRSTTVDDHLTVKELSN